jgi:hypothetical protein
MIYNAGIRRPPHTGAALLALRSQLYREKLRYFRQIGYTEGIRAYCDFFGIDAAALDRVLGRETCIVPVNLTYFPIRAKKNVLNRVRTGSSTASPNASRRSLRSKARCSSTASTSTSISASRYRSGRI